jgi:hypothetical protein
VLLFVAGLTDMFLEEGQYPTPGVFGRDWVVVSGFLEEWVAGVGVGLDVVGDAVAFERRVELAPGPGRQVLFGVGTNDGTSTGDGVEGARVRAVERCHDSEALVGAGPGDSETAAHAEADCTEPSSTPGCSARTPKAALRS